MSYFRSCYGGMALFSVILNMGIRCFIQQVKNSGAVPAAVSPTKGFEKTSATAQHVWVGRPQKPDEPEDLPIAYNAFGKKGK